MKKSTKFILYFCLSLFLISSCTTEKEFVENNNSTKHYSIKEYNAKEANNLVKFQAIKQSIVKKLRSMSNNESSREILGFTVDDYMMKEISATNYSSYNMLILRDVPTTDYFENLVIEQKSDTTNAYVVKYTPSTTANLSNGGFDGTIEASKVYGQTCIVCPGSGESGSDGDGGGFSGSGGGGSSSGLICTTILMCNEPDTSIPGLPMPHVAYCGGCQSFPVTTCSTIYTPSSLGNGGASTGLNVGPANGALHGGSGTNSGASTPYNNPIVVPVPPTLEQTINNFVLNLSDPQQLWWNNPINSDCVNQIKAFLSKSFPNIALEDFEFANWAVTYLMANTNVTAQQFENWFMGKSEGFDGDYDDAYWSNPSLTFPTQNLPSFNDFQNAYPKNISGTFEMDFASVYNLVGGVPKAMRDGVLSDSDPLNNQSYDNACALRTSRALNYSGVIIPNIPGKTFKGDDDKYYFLGARNLYNWMIKTFPPSISNSIVKNQADGGTNGINFPNLLGSNQGIYILLPVNQSSTGFGASGHAGIYTSPELTHYYFGATGGVKLITLWLLN